MQSFYFNKSIPSPALLTTNSSGLPQQQRQLYENMGHLLDIETSKTGIEVVKSLEKGNSGSSISLFKEAKLEVPSLPYRPYVPIADQLGKEHLLQDNLSNTSTSNSANKPSTSNQTRLSSLPVENLGHIPPVGLISPPPLPVTPPLHLTLPPPLSAAGKYSQRGASGTVQFAGMCFASSAREQAEAVTKEKDRIASAGVKGLEKKEDGEDQIDLAGEGAWQGEEATLCRKNLMVEISTVGQTALKHTNCPRSPSGTPMKKSFMSGVGGNCVMTVSTNTHQHHSNSEMLQIALLAKFHSLHSTPYGQRHGYQQLDCSNSFEFSSAWSDINSSVQIFDDTGVTNTSTVVQPRSELTLAKHTNEV